MGPQWCLAGPPWLLVDACRTCEFIILFTFRDYFIPQMHIFAVCLRAMWSAFRCLQCYNASTACVHVFCVLGDPVIFACQDWQLTSSHCIGQTPCSLHILDFGCKFFRLKLHLGSAATQLPWTTVGTPRGPQLWFWFWIFYERP